MKVHTLETGYFKLDGGAMFGVVPKAIWNKLNPADENNMCTWAMRCLLIEHADRLIVVDTGIGNKQDDKFFSHFYLHGEDSLDTSLEKLGYTKADITDVFLTHLHFDHCGGCIEYAEDGNTLQPAFPNAVFWSNKTHWQAAVNPNAREKASFLKENILPMQESGKLRFIEKPGEWLPGIKIHYCSGHTESMMLLEMEANNKKILYTADLMPSTSHIKLPYVMGYDVRPLKTLEEKLFHLHNAVENSIAFVYEHDPKIECSTFKKTERGVAVDKTLTLSEYLEN